VLLVLGQTPAFHATDPTASGFFGAGATSMPRRAAWQRYVGTVARRDATVWGRTVDFQVWNEGNNAQYWTGTAEQLATLTRWTSDVLRAVDPGARLVAPAMGTRLSGELDTVRAYYGQRSGGRPVADYVDAVALHLYPPETRGPERAMRQLREAQSILAEAGVDKPIYDTEINYGAVGNGDPPAPVSTDRQVAFVLRTYLLHAQFGVRRVYWYAWDRRDLMNTVMVRDDFVTPTDAGRAFGVVRSWVLGTRPDGCTRSETATWTCRFTADGEVRTAVWNAWQVTAVTPPPGATAYDTGDGTTRPVAPGETVTVDQVPVLFRSAA
jgi:hypothetical protein